MINTELLAYTLFILNGFILGSLPFGYIITKLSTSKNILEIGWKKNSASNVMKNIGKWQGITTAALDLLKGYIAVLIAINSGTPSLVVALTGVAAITGHNWSPLLNFQGGRGIATLAGAMLCLFPSLALLLIILSGLFAILWTASIGTIIAIALGLIISFSNPEYWGVFLLLLLSIIPISIKRLSPIKEILPIENNCEIISNRLIFDQDEMPPYRIKSRKSSTNETVKNDSEKEVIKRKPRKKPILKKEDISPKKNTIKKTTRAKTPKKIIKNKANTIKKV